MSDDFSDHPVSISEARGMRDSSPGSWQPRDILIMLLREIDAGRLTPDHVMLGFGTVQPDGGAKTGFFQAGTLNSYGQMGLAAQMLDLVSHPESKD